MTYIAYFSEIGIQIKYYVDYVHFKQNSSNLKSCCEQCCLQTGSWYSNSSNTTGLPLAEEEPSWDWEDPSGLWRIWLLGRRHTSLEPPCSRTATTSGSLYRSATTSLREYLRKGKERKSKKEAFSLWVQTKMHFISLDFVTNMIWGRTTYFFS